MPATPPAPAPSLHRQVLSLALPALGALIAEPIFVLIDSAMVGHLGTAPLAGLGVASTIVQTIVYLFVFLLFSTTTRAAQAYGRRNIAHALTTGIQAIYLATIIGTALALFLFFGSTWLLSFFDASPEALPHAHAYLQASSPGIIGMFIVMAATGTLRGMHDTRAALIISTLGAATNVGLNAIFIYALNLGVAGSGIGTSITQLLMASALVIFMGVHARTLHTQFTSPTPHAPSLRSQISLRPTFDGVRSSIHDGAWLFIRTIALRIALMSTVIVVAHMGVTAVAAHHIAWTVWGFTAFALDALAIAGQTLFASTAAQHHERTPANEQSRSPQAQLLHLLTRWALWAGTILGALLAIITPFIPRAFSTDPAVLSATLIPLIIASATMPISSVIFLYDGIMMGADRAAYLAQWGMALLLLHLPALWLVAYIAPSVTTNIALALVWVEYTLIFMGGRATYLWLGSRDLRA